MSFKALNQEKTAHIYPGNMFHLGDSKWATKSNVSPLVGTAIPEADHRAPARCQTNLKPKARHAISPDPTNGVEGGAACCDRSTPSRINLRVESDSKVKET